MLNFKALVFMSGIVLHLNIWNKKRNGSSTDLAMEMDDVHRCMQILKRSESRYVEIECSALWIIEHIF